MFKLNKLLALVISFIIIFIAFIFFVHNVSKVSVIESPCELESANIKNDAKIFLNLYGIGHITAKYDEDLFFAVGYYHAQQRLWQMDFTRRLAEGRLSEIFGSDLLSVDKFMRCFRMKEISKNNWDSLSTKSQTILKAYSEGVNLYIEENKDKLSFEFGALDYQPEKWEPYQSILIGRYLSFEFELSIWSDAALGQIADKLGIEKAKEFIPFQKVENLNQNITDNIFNPTQTLPKREGLKSNPTQNQYTREAVKSNPTQTLPASREGFKSHLTQNQYTKGGFKSDPTQTLPASREGFKKVNHSDLSAKSSSPSTCGEGFRERSDLSGLAAFVKNLFAVKEIIGINGSSVGSNCWSVRNSDSTGVSSILANDPHMVLSLPARWIQMHITSDNINATGLTIPGIPLVLSGRNDNIAWGITNIMADGFDYFIEKISDNGKYYFRKDSVKKSIINKIDTIKIKNSNNHIYYQRSTDNSIIISDFHINKNMNFVKRIDSLKTKNDFFNKYAFSFKWIGNEVSDEILALYKINTSSDWTSFKYACRTWLSPGLNFHYSDRNGNIGVVPAASIPLRQSKCEPSLPNPAWQANYGWSDIIRLQDAEIDKYNPPIHYLASANNIIENLGLNNFISNYWEPSSRIERINEFLNYDKFIDLRDAQYMQTDYLSPYSKKVLKIVFSVIDSNYKLLSKFEKEIYAELIQWDNIMSASSSGAAIYNIYIKNLIYNIFYDELGDIIYSQYVFISSLPTNRLLEILEKKNSLLFDDVQTKEKENRDYQIFKSFKDACTEAINIFKNQKVKKWKYGTIHKIKPEHIFSKNKMTEPVVSIGEFEIGGNNTTLNNTEWNLNKPYQTVVGASMRMIADMRLEYIYTALPGGSSGDAMSPNYSDQFQLWLNGGYIKIPIARNPSPDFILKTTFLQK
jgi:acyl-homoserine lactone acylase PvdQ